MIRLGYVIKDNDKYKLSVPVYTRDQYNNASKMVDEYIENELAPIIKELNISARSILANHTPKHLQEQVSGVASMDKFTNGVSIPAIIMIEKGTLSEDWTPNEMPTNYIILNV